MDPQHGSQHALLVHSEGILMEVETKRVNCPIDFVEKLELKNAA